MVPRGHLPSSCTLDTQQGFPGRGSQLESGHQDLGSPGRKEEGRRALSSEGGAKSLGDYTLQTNQGLPCFNRLQTSAPPRWTTPGPLHSALYSLLSPKEQTPLPCPEEVGRPAAMCCPHRGGGAGWSHLSGGGLAASSTALALGKSKPFLSSSTELCGFQPPPRAHHVCSPELFPVLFPGS